MGIVPCFDPIWCSVFGADFRLEKGEFGFVTFKEIVSLFENLMLGL